jgi:cell division protein FtsW (lipid II flippase)
MISAFRGRFRFTETELLLAPSLMAIVGLLTIFLVPRHSLDWTWSDIWISFAFVAIILGINISFGVLGVRGDQVLFPVTAALSGLGLLMIQRLYPALASINPYFNTLAQKQFVFLVAGFAVLWLTTISFRGRINLLRRYKYTALFLSLGLLAATFVFGTSVNGARIWISAGPIQIQPSEIVKVTLVIFMAGYLDENKDLLGSVWRVGFLRLPPIPYLLPMILMWLASVLVLVVQNDLGTALLFFGIFLVMIYMATAKPLYVVIGLASFAIASYGAYVAFDRIGDRVQNWLDPWQDPIFVGYQPIQSDYSLTAGGVIGTGLAQGQPWRIPEVHTDFVFSAIGEELGLLGSVAVLALFMVLVMRAFGIAISSRSGFSRLLAGGLAATLALQTVIIIGGVLRVIPLTGITLPFISYGGSSLLTNFLIIGLLLAISDQNRAV